MKLRTFEVWSTALLLMGLGLTSLASSPARADDDEDNRSDRKMIRIESEDDRDEGRGQGYLGVQVQRLTSALRRARDIPESVEGILVSNVESGSPASDGGIKRGDVILEVGRDPVSSPADLVEKVRALDPGKRVPVLIWRDGTRRTVTLTVGSRPAGGDFPAPPPMPRWEESGPGSDSPDMPRPQMLRRRADMERQLREIRDQLSKLRDEDARLQQEIERLRADLRERGLERRDRDQRDRDRNDDEDD